MKENQKADGQGQQQLNAARKEGENAVLSERKGKGAFSKTASLDLGQKNPALYLLCFYPAALFLCAFASFLQHLTLLAWSLFIA